MKTSFKRREATDQQQPSLGIVAPPQPPPQQAPAPQPVVQQAPQAPQPVVVPQPAQAPSYYPPVPVAPAPLPAQPTAPLPNHYPTQPAPVPQPAAIPVQVEVLPPQAPAPQPAQPAYQQPYPQPAGVDEQVPLSAYSEEGEETVVDHSTAVSVPISSGKLVQGEINHSDIRFNRLNLVQKVGDLSNVFQCGSFVLAKEFVLAAPIVMSVVSVKKEYQEKVPWGQRGAVFQSANEVSLAGMTLDRATNRMNPNIKLCEPMLHLQLMIRLQNEEGMDENHRALYAYGDGRHYYAVAMWTVKSTAYTAVANPFFKEMLSRLRIDPLNPNSPSLPYLGVWELNAKLETGMTQTGKNTWAVPVMRFKERSSNEFTGMMSNLLNPKSLPEG